MGVLDWFVMVLAVLFVLGVVGCLMALPLVIRQFVGVLFEKDEPREQERQEAAAD
jgi:hypothetical protein